MIFVSFTSPRKLNLVAMFSQCVCPRLTVFSEGSRCFIAGWGETFNNEQGNQLHELDMPLLADKHCKVYNVNAFIDQRGACTGDADGPLMCLHAGILSWAEGCRLDSTPAVFSDIKYQMEFIKSIINNPCLVEPCQNDGKCVLSSVLSSAQCPFPAKL